MSVRRPESELRAARCTDVLSVPSSTGSLLAHHRLPPPIRIRHPLALFRSPCLLLQPIFVLFLQPIDGLQTWCSRVVVDSVPGNPLPSPDPTGSCISGYAVPTRPSWQSPVTFCNLKRAFSDYKASSHRFMHQWLHRAH